jgi:AAA family ATP:ADP antiporter
MTELRPTLLAFAHFFLVISSYYIIKPVRDALFVKTIGPDRMPLFYLVVAGVVLVVVGLYNQIIRQLDSRRFTLYLQGLVALNILIFWWLMWRTDLRLSVSFYIWASVYNVLMVSVFWSLTNDIFDAARGRKLYGVIGGGGIVGGIAGGVAARYLPLSVGIAHCLLVAGLLVVAAVAVTLLRLADRSRAARPAGALDSGRSARHADTWRDLTLTLTDRHVRLIAAVVFFVTVGKTFFNYHYYHVVDASISGTERAASFFGTVSVATSVSSALLQFLVTTVVLRRFGARAGLLFLPATLLVAMGVLSLSPGLLVSAALNVAQQSTSYSINQSSKELLYTPCSEQVKYRTKAVIDMFVFRFGDAFAALLLLLIHTRLELPPWVSLAAGLVCVGYWLVMVIRADDPTVR